MANFWYCAIGCSHTPSRYGEEGSVLGFTQTGNKATWYYVQLFLRVPEDQKLPTMVMLDEAIWQVRGVNLHAVWMVPGIFRVNTFSGCMDRWSSVEETPARESLCGIIFTAETTHVLFVHGVAATMSTSHLLCWNLSALGVEGVDHSCNIWRHTTHLLLATVGWRKVVAEAHGCSTIGPKVASWQQSASFTDLEQAVEISIFCVSASYVCQPPT